MAVNRWFLMRSFGAWLVLWLAVVSRIYFGHAQEEPSNNRQNIGDDKSTATKETGETDYGLTESTETSSCQASSSDMLYEEGECHSIRGVIKEEDDDPYVWYSEPEMDFGDDDDDDDVDEELQDMKTTNRNPEDKSEQSKAPEIDKEDYDPLADLGVPQRFASKIKSSKHNKRYESPFTRQDFDVALQKMSAYKLSIANDPELHSLSKNCKNDRPDCTIKAMLGGCKHTSSQSSMQVNCPLACHACDMLLYERRCPYDPNAPMAWNEPNNNALNEMFERILSEPKFEIYSPKVWSRPRWSEPNPDYYDTPWVISLDHFLSDEEIQRLLELASLQGYHRSRDGTQYLKDGSIVANVVNHRTSYNTWCLTCHQDPLGRAVLNRIQDVTQIPQTHFNFLQILRYTEGQYYGRHHDFDWKDSFPRQPGPRILTVFLYLNDVDVEHGGGTQFPYVGITFQPKKGRAVIWPNVLNEDWFEIDPMTAHEALPVTSGGVKYAANAWIHLHDYQGPHSRNCAF